MIADNNILPLSHHCFIHRYKMMGYCWKLFPEERPTFAELAQNVRQQLRIVDDDLYLIASDE